FINLLNDAERIDRSLIDPYIKNGMTKKDAKDEYGLLDNDFYFSNSDISQSQIYLYDSLVTLTLLVFKQMSFKDRIHRVNFVKGIYGYNFNNEFVKDIKEIRDYLYWNKSDFSPTLWKEYMRFFSSYRLKDLRRYHQVDIDEIMDEYESNIRYYNQMIYVGELVEEA